MYREHIFLCVREHCLLNLLTVETKPMEGFNVE